MGKVSTTWLLPGHSGRACNHESIYTKQNRRTGKVYSVKVCNPNDTWSEDQEKARSDFGKISAAINEWVKQNKEQATDDYVKVYTAFDRQHKYGTLRGFMFGKGYATLDPSTGKVTIKVGNSISTSGGGSGNGELG